MSLPDRGTQRLIGHIAPDLRLGFDRLGCQRKGMIAIVVARRRRAVTSARSVDMLPNG